MRVEYDAFSERPVLLLWRRCRSCRNGVWELDGAVELLRLSREVWVGSASCAALCGSVEMVQIGSKRFQSLFEWTACIRFAAV